MSIGTPREPGGSSTDAQEIAEPLPLEPDAANLRELLTRLVVLTDFCWSEGEAYLGQQFGSPFHRDYLQGKVRLQTTRSPLFNSQIQMACLFGAEIPAGAPPLSAEQARLVEFFERALSDQAEPPAELLADMRKYAERTESGEIAKTYLTDINQELFGIGLFTTVSHGLDACGSRFCRPLFHMCDPFDLGEFRGEDLAASFGRLCVLRERVG